MKKNKSGVKKTSWNSFLRSCLQLHRNSFIAVVIFSFIINILMLTVPLYLLQIFNRVVPNKSSDTLFFLTGLVIVAVITLSILEATRRFIFVRIGSWLDGRLGGLVLSGSISRSVSKCRGTSAQGLRDLATVRRLFANSGLFPILDAPWTPIFMLVLFMLHPVIGIISLTGAIVLLVLALLNEFSTRKLINDANSASSSAENYATAILRNSDVIEAMGMRKNAIDAWENLHGTSVELQTQSSIRSSRMASIAKFIRMMLQIAVIGAAGLLVLDGQLSAGGLIASVLLMRRAVAPMDRAISSWKVIIKARKSFRNVSARLDQAPELNASNTLPIPSGYLSVKHVAYKYPSGSKQILRDVTFRAKPGEIIGLAGETAAGKSTLARLIVGLAKPNSGYVRIGKVDLVRWGAEVLGPYVGYLPQSTELFSGTIRQNIARMGEGNFDAVVSAAKSAGVHDMVMQFPDSYDTDIGLSGAYLSGGQRQRLALARVLYGNPKLVVLDEPEANLDREGRAALAQALAELKRNKAIVVLISHQKSVLDSADRLLVLRDGKIKSEIDKQLKSVSAKKSGKSGRSQIISIDPLKQGK
jgi:PrtD family type I secretion system ABC transporter